MKFTGADPAAGAARLVLDGERGLVLALDQDPFELKGLVVERPMGVDRGGAHPAFVLERGRLLLDGVLIRSGESGSVRVGVGRGDGDAVAVVTSSTLVSATGPAVRVGRRGRVRVANSRLLGDLEAASSRAFDLVHGKSGRDLEDNLMVVVGGELDVADAVLGATAEAACSRTTAPWFGSSGRAWRKSRPTPCGRGRPR